MWLRACASAWWPRVRTGARAEALSKELEAHASDPDGLLGGLMAAASTNLAKHERLAHQQMSALRCVIGVELFQRQTGAYPESIDAVVKTGLLSEAPADPFTGGRILYRRLETTDAQGRAYLVYSAGAGGEDLGGREPEAAGEPGVQRRRGRSGSTR